MVSWSDRPDTAPDPACFSTSRTTFVEKVGGGMHCTVKQKGGGQVLASCNQQSACIKNRHVSKADTERLIAWSCNLGQNKMEQQTPIPPKSRMKPREGQKRAIFPSLIWGGGGDLGFPFILSKIVGSSLLWALLCFGISASKKGKILQGEIQY